MSATESLTELYASIRTHLLNYTDGGAAPNTITAAVTGRMYNETPPAALTPSTQPHPYVLLTIDGLPQDESMDPTRIEFSVEIQVIHKPRENIAAARRIADLAWKALATYKVPMPATDFVRIKIPALPTTLPPAVGSGDREIVQIMVTSEGWAYWKAMAAALAAA